MKIKIPEDYTLPEDVADGDTFEELTTYRVEGDSIVPTMLAGTEIPEDKEGEKPETEMEVNIGGEGEGGNPMKGMAQRMMGMS
jgi:hypothetical protein